MRARDWIASQNLSTRFALAAGIVMLAAGLLIGWWVTGIISRSVVSNTAGATALFMDSVIGPLAQELETADTLSIGPIRAIEEMMSGSELGKRVVSVKIWKPDGRLAYAEETKLIGQSFPVTPGLQGAFSGRIVAELDDLDKEESQNEREIGIPLLEIYSPIRKAWSGEVIAVAEFYEDATELEATLDRAQFQTWGIVLAAASLIGLALFGIVRRGSNLIEQQGRALAARIEEAEKASEQNRTLRRRVERASGRVAELNEHFLRRISADLHDGPAQLVGLASLRLGILANGRTKAERVAEKEIVKSALDRAIQDIRDICNGLSLPEVESLPLGEMVANVVRSHQRYTGAHVDLSADEPLPDASHALKICVYRFVQEGLNNGFRHAGGIRQSVRIVVTGNRLEVRTSNGPRLDQNETTSGGMLGLAGLKERVESLGGRFEFTTEAGQDVVMSMSVEI